MGEGKERKANRHRQGERRERERKERGRKGGRQTDKQTDQPTLRQTEPETARVKDIEREGETQMTKRQERTGDREGNRQTRGLFVCWLVALRPSNMLVHLRDGSAQTILRAATLRQKLQIQLSTSPSHSILTPGRPVPGLTL